MLPGPTPTQFKRGFDVWSVVKATTALPIVGCFIAWHFRCTYSFWYWLVRKLTSCHGIKKKVGISLLEQVWYCLLRFKLLLNYSNKEHIVTVQNKITDTRISTNSATGMLMSLGNHRVSSFSRRYELQWKTNPIFCFVYTYIHSVTPVFLKGVGWAQKTFHYVSTPISNFRLKEITGC